MRKIKSQRPDAALHPYRGDDLERLSRLGESYVLRRFAVDDGKRRYRFNRLGYRGPDPDPGAEKRVYVFGESHACGYFVDLEQSWPWLFVDRWCAEQGIERACVEVLNFADPGASNAAIARQVISQCSARPPDLVLVHFADIRRSEVILDGRAHRVGPWLLDESATRSARRAPADLHPTLGELLDRGEAYFRHALGPKARWQAAVPDATCFLEALREILLVQSFCRAEGLEWVATCDRMEDLRAAAPQEHPLLAPLVAALDETALCPSGIWSVAAENDEPGHAGRERHRLFAELVFDFYRS